MTYFAPFGQTVYKFGEADNAIVSFQNISAYADIVDKFKEAEQSYLKYSILDGDRPDVLSSKMYGDQKYYWTYYLLNDHIRRQGWPLSYNEMEETAKEQYPNTTLVFRTDGTGIGHVGHTDATQNLVNIWKIGSVIYGAQSGAYGTVVRKDLDQGHVIISDSVGIWIPGEAVYFNRITQNPLAAFDPNPFAEYADITIYEHAILNSFSAEYLSCHHMENAAGEWVDTDPNTESQAALLVEKTHLDVLQAENDKLREINYLKPEVIRSVHRAFIERMTG